LEKLVHFDSEEPSLSDLGYQISLGIRSKFWDNPDIEFKPFSSKPHEKDLVYLLLKSTSDGFGAILLRSRSYTKNFKLNLPNLSYGKFHFFNHF